MRRTLVLLLTLVLIAPAAHARSGEVPAMQYSIEWGATATFWNLRDFNYLDAEGSRVADNSSFFKYYFNAEFLAGVGFNLSDRFCLGVRTGLVGVEDNIRVIPLLARATYAFKGVCNDGAFIYGEGGVGLRDIELSRMISMASLGVGHRWALSRRYSIDMALAVRATLDNPTLNASAVSSNAALYGAATVSLGLNF